ncbi:hypothetical protein [Sporisorium scitamineum]|uniref:Retrotransposon gag domain-containing protein n=1 Tax=Sporisorium scitamineum TaxID=49012 RepID=A0A0F7RZ42_9BASI|nr:hypothetical protein [Sporisorium scitamineum]
MPSSPTTLPKPWLPVPPIPLFVGYFSGSANGVNGARSQPLPKHFVKAFKHYLIHTGERDDTRAAKLFKSFLKGPAETWIKSLPKEMQSSWNVLQKAFVN